MSNLKFIQKEKDITLFRKCTFILNCLDVSSDLAALLNSSVITVPEFQ